ncbi:MAG TPA: TIGR00366 family protein [Nevskia sp.]|nr:TIGR00366 family protein [Nevskia sp.]HET7797665.1 TIGR00366 family protein [Nevskia sp.]
MNEGNAMSRLALRFCAWSEHWFPDAWVFSVTAVLVVAAAAALNGAAPTAVAKAFGDGYWTLIPFTLQMCYVLVGGHVVASSPPARRLIEALARRPTTGPGAIGMVAIVTMLLSLIHWALGLVLGGLLVKALGRRRDLPMDYRAASAAAYLGLGAVWALGLSSSAAQLQANPASMSRELLAITGVIPFTQTIFLWQSLLMTAILVVLSTLIAVKSAPAPAQARTATMLGVDCALAAEDRAPASRPGERPERSPVLNLALFALGALWLYGEFAGKGAIGAITSLNTYNFLFIMLGLLLQWSPRRFLDSVYEAVPSTAGIMIQFPLYAGIAMMLTAAKAPDGSTIASHLSTFFASIATRDSFPVVIGAYSAVLGFFVPSGGGKWLIEAPYVMQAANDLQAHLGWAVQIYNAAEALPNLINPLFMLPLLGIVGLRTRDIVGYTFLQFLFHTPVVLFLLWILGLTLTYVPPQIPQ